MTLADVVFVPAAPLLVPAVAGGGDDLDAEMRDGCLALVASALGGRDQALVVAPTAVTGEWPGAATWDFGGFGVPRPDAAGRERLPWSLGIGAWLLDAAGWAGSRGYVGITPSGSPSAGDLAAGSTVVLVVGDGSACRTEKAPGYLDERAEAFDAGIEAALRAGDAAALAATDEVLAGELLCRSVPAWRWVAAAAAGRSVTEATMAFAAAPYGVAYFVARWQLSQ